MATARYTHCTFFTARGSSAVCSKNTYDPSTGAITVPIPLNDWERLIRISAYRGGPQTTVFVSRVGVGLDRRGLTSDVRVCSSFERTQAVPNDENSSAEASERSMDKARPGDQGPDSIQGETPDKDGLVAIMTEDPIGVAERGQGICTGEV